MSLVSGPEVTHVVVAAWHCDACEVQGRSLADAAVECWNCGGPVTVTARPSVPIAEFEQQGHVPVPTQRAPLD
jgi:hypothetical protein